MESYYLQSIVLCIGYAIKNGARIRAFLILSMNSTQKPRIRLIGQLFVKLGGGKLKLRRYEN